MAEQGKHSVDDGTLKAALAIVMTNYRSSFPTAEDGTATLMLWRRYCDMETRWLDDEVFEKGLDEMVRKHKGSGFLPEWSVLREYCSQVHTRREGRRRTAELRERSLHVPASSLAMQLADGKRVNGR